MSFYDRYELLDLVRSGAIKTFAGRQKQTGRSVAVHLLPGGKSGHARVMEKLDELPEQERAEILETGEHEGTFFVVTEPWQRTGSFEDWILSAGIPSIGPDSVARAGSWRVPTAEFGKKKADPVPPPAGEFTMMFQPGDPPNLRDATPPTPEPVAPRPPADPHPDAPPEPGTPVSTPGVFTSMFQADQIRSFLNQHSDASSHPASEQQENATGLFEPNGEPSSGGAKEPGEFTRQFQAAQKSTDALKEPGEFTKNFQLGLPAVPARTDTSSSPPAAVPDTKPDPKNDMAGREMPAKTPVSEPVQKTATEPGEFTRMFQPPAVQQRGPEREKQQDPGEFTRMFRPGLPSPPPASPPGSAEKQARSPDAVDPNEGRDPGEFTRIFRALKPQPGTDPPPVRPAEPLRRIETPEPAVRSESVGAREPGEFTRLFQTGPPPAPVGEERVSASPVPRAPVPAPSPAPAIPVSQQPSGTPGEFTKLFGTPPQAQSPPSHPAYQDPYGAQRSSLPHGGQAVGEFTRLFGAAAKVPPAPPGGFGQPPAGPKPTQSAPPMGEYTRMFSTPAAPGAPVAGTPPAPAFPAQQPAPFQPAPFHLTQAQPQPQQPAAQPAQGAGEFTRMFQMPAPPPTLAGPPAATATPSAAQPARSKVPRVRKANYVPLFIGLGVLLLAAVLVIVILALRK